MADFCFFGAGKSTLLLQVAKHCTITYADPTAETEKGAFVWYVTQSNEMAMDFYNKAQKVFMPTELLLLSIVSQDGSFQDSGWNFLQKAAHLETEEDMQLLEALDNLIDIL